MEEAEIIVFNKNNVECGKSSKGYGHTHFAKRAFRRGEVVVHGWGSKVIDHQTNRFSIQIGHKRHFLPKKWTGRYWNHFCEPNCFVRTRADGFPDLVAARSIRVGEEITYGYFMTEHSWTSCANEKNVECLCGTKKCRKKILSFSQLDTASRKKLIKKGHVSSYLHSV